MIREVLVVHDLDALARGDEALVDQAVKELGRCFDHGVVRGGARVASLATVGGACWIVGEGFGGGTGGVRVIFGFHVEDHLECFLVPATKSIGYLLPPHDATNSAIANNGRNSGIHGNDGAKAGEVEVVFDKVLCDLGKVLVANDIAEAGDPALLFLHACG